MSRLDTTVILIPARMASTRMEGKPLVQIKGKPLLHHTYDRAKLVGAKSVYIVTSDVEIQAYCLSVAIPCIMVDDDPPCVCGTERIIRATSEFRKSKKYLWYVNWQVDEPLVNPDSVKELVLVNDAGSRIGTLLGDLHPWALLDQNVVKVTMTTNFTCQWFSRLSFAYAFHHIGVYVFHYSHLNDFTLLYGDQYKSEFAKIDGLEQMAWIDWGRSIEGSVIVGCTPPSVNVPEDLESVEEWMDDEAKSKGCRTAYTTDDSGS